MSVVPSDYRSGFASIGRTIALAADWDAKRTAWRNSLHEALSTWNGIERQDIVDELQDIADAQGLIEHFNQDAIQQDIAEEVQRATLPFLRMFRQKKKHF